MLMRNTSYLLHKPRVESQTQKAPISTLNSQLSTLDSGLSTLDSRLTPHLMDFGLAKRETGEITMTVEGQILGTPAYTAPERVVSPRTGCSLIRRKYSCRMAGFGRS